jgi:pimeloyl-ACP methyl ester carboxylesterase
MGGYIAMTVAKYHPEAVRSLVLIATTIGGPEVNDVILAFVSADTRFPETATRG